MWGLCQNFDLASVQWKATLGRRLGTLCHITRVILSFQRQCDYTGKNKLERVCRDTWRSPTQEATTVGAGVVLVVE